MPRAARSPHPSGRSGAVLGIAILLAILGAPAADHAMGAIRTAWWVMVGTGAGAAACALALGRVHARDIEFPAPPVSGPVLPPASALPTAGSPVASAHLECHRQTAVVSDPLEL